MKSASSKTKNFPLFSGHIKLLESIANSKIASVLIIGITGVFWYILNFVWPTPDLVSLGTGKMMPDMMPAGYSLAELQALLTQYGRIGREDYQLFLMT